MKRLFLTLTSLALAAGSYGADRQPKVEDRPVILDKANVYPLCLDDSIQFRKTINFLNDPELNKPSFDDMINFERLRVNFGAVQGYERRQRYGNYFTFYWRTKRPADLTLRFEYRQQNLGAHVQARELYYKGVKGSVTSRFNIVADDYNDDGKVTGWRAILIENGKIVALNQSFLWN